MKTLNTQVDEYIKKSPDFAQPILTHLRKLIHSANPSIIESIKWGVPHFEYKGVICSMAAFKQHMAFGFWKEDLIPGMKQYIKEKEAMGSWGKITTLKGLPPDQDIIRFVKTAIELNEKGIKVEKKPVEKNQKVETPDYFLKAIRANKKAFATFEAFSSSHKKEYVDWIIDAKTDETRQRRIKTAVEWMSEGKPRMWKYMKKS